MGADTTKNVILYLTNAEAQTLADILCHISGNPKTASRREAETIGGVLDSLGFQYNPHTFKGNLEALCLVQGKDVLNKPGFYSVNSHHYLSLNGVLYSIDAMRLVKPVSPIATCEYKQISFADL